MVDWATLGDRLEADGEFRVAARHWNATLRLDLGADSHAIRFEEGHVVAVEPCASDHECDVFVSAPDQVWDRMLQVAPRPFYHDFFMAQLHHGVVMNPDLLDYAAYYPALRRLLEVLREARGQR